MDFTGEMVELSIKELFIKFETISSKLSNQQNKIAESIIKEIKERLQFLKNVGLDYLTLNRKSELFQRRKSKNKIS